MKERKRIKLPMFLEIASDCGLVNALQWKKADIDYRRLEKKTK